MNRRTSIEQALYEISSTIEAGYVQHVVPMASISTLALGQFRTRLDSP
jgi:hypothetical protein